MNGYVLHFLVYILAMSGLICFAVFLYKKIVDGGFKSSGAKQLSIEETMSINPRKSLMIVKAGDERFLLASDVDKTTLIAKLGEDKHLTRNNLAENNLQLKPEHIEKLLNKTTDVVPIDNSKRRVSQQKIAGVNLSTNARMSRQNNSSSLQKQPIKLEVITEKNPKVNRNNYYKSQNYSKASGNSAIRGMAQKINEI